MSNYIFHRILSSLYMWKLDVENCQITEKMRLQLRALNSRLIDRILEIERGNTDKLQKEMKIYYKEILKIIPNYSIEFNAIHSYLLEEFNNLNSEILTEQSKGAYSILESIQSAFSFDRVIPRVFLPDLKLENEQLKFMTKIFETKDFTLNYISKLYISIFNEFISGFNNNTEQHIKDVVSKVVNSFNRFLETYQASLREKLEKFLEEKTINLSFIKVYLKAIMISESENSPEERFATIYENIYIEEPFELKQIISLSEKKLLITILVNSLKLECIIFEDYEVHRLEKKFNSNDTYIAQGSVPESLVMFINSERECIEAQLTERKIKRIAKICNYPSKVQRVDAACYIKNEKRILFLYPPGALEQISFNNGSQKDFSNIVPKIYKNLYISDCGKYYLLVCEDECYLFNQRMRIVEIQKLSPLHFFMKSGKAYILCQDNENLYFKYFQVVEDAKGSSSIIDLNANVITHNYRKTLELGKSILKEFLTSNNFEEAKAKSIENPKNNNS
ncbi:hypothetical protein SteCoe_33993 [Stentor coeruleus]|uniref:Uncharacterized protein n=1 Tax=Stentor coeruleus TaxID=5963 RepID=A0A1R2AVI5_9CILI|nr:hypothetical protein SteCoe_33993 [Stentor coeruleus]